MKKKLSKEYKRLIVNPAQIVSLAKLCYVPWKRDLDTAARSWKNDRLPEVEKKIDQHNKDVEAKKSTYSFNTYLPISEQDKKAIIDKERDFYIFTSQKVYEFLSEFAVTIDNKTVENTTPDFLERQDLENATEITFSVKSANGNKNIQLQILAGNRWNKSLSYSIEGNDDRWINSVEEDIEGEIRNMQKPHDFTSYTTWAALISAIFLSITFSKTISRFSLLGFIKAFAPVVNLSVANFVFSFLFCLAIWILISRKINPLFPDFAIKKEYKPFDSNFIKVVFFIVSAIFSPLIYSGLEFVFK